MPCYEGSPNGCFHSAWPTIIEQEAESPTVKNGIESFPEITGNLKNGGLFFSDNRGDMYEYQRNYGKERPKYVEVDNFGNGQVGDGESADGGPRYSGNGLNHLVDACHPEQLVFGYNKRRYRLQGRRMKGIAY